MLKNVAGQQWQVFAFDESTAAPVENDEANITADIKVGAGAALQSTNDTNPTPVAGKPGYYVFDLTQAETNADDGWIYPESSTPGVDVIGVPGHVEFGSQPGVPIAFFSPYTAKTKTLEIVQNVDYKSGTPVGQLKFDLSEFSNISAGDTVKFAATFDSGKQTINASGTVQDESGTLFAVVELTRASHTDFELDVDDMDARFWLSHVNGSGDESPLLAARKLVVLTNDTGG
jgi:hypothetical protein